MASSGDQSFVVLLQVEGRKRGEPGVDASHRRAISEVSVLRFPSDGALVAAQGHLCGASPGLSSDAPHGAGGGLSSAKDQHTPSGAPDLSLSSQGNGHRPAQSSLVCRHHVHPRSAQLFVPGCDHGLGHASCTRLAIVEHHGCPLLP